MRYHALLIVLALAIDACGATDGPALPPPEPDPDPPPATPQPATPPSRAPEPEPTPIAQPTPEPSDPPLPPLTVACLESVTLETLTTGGTSTTTIPDFADTRPGSSLGMVEPDVGRSRRATS